MRWGPNLSECRRPGYAPGPPKGRRWKRITSWSLLVLACLLAVLSVVVVFARTQLLNTDAYVNTMAPLASDPVIQTQIATKGEPGIDRRTDLNQQLKDALPQKARVLVAHGLGGQERRLLDHVEGGAVTRNSRSSGWVSTGQPTSSWSTC